MAMNDTIKNRTSIVFHQIGVSAQQISEHDFARNKNGVATQWIKQSKLAEAPMKSVLIEPIILSINAIELQIYDLNI